MAISKAALTMLSPRAGFASDREAADYAIG